MKLKRSFHGADVLELNEDDLKALGRGEDLNVSGMIIGREIPDKVRYYSYDSLMRLCMTDESSAKLKVTYDGRTGEMKTAEVLK